MRGIRRQYTKAKRRNPFVFAVECREGANSDLESDSDKDSPETQRTSIQRLVRLALFINSFLIHHRRSGSPERERHAPVGVGMSELSWRWISASVIGSSHTTTGSECQDSHLCNEIQTPNGQVLLAFVSDGAGSAAKSAIGSRMICDVLPQDKASEDF